MAHYGRLSAVVTAGLVLILSGILRSNGQINTACTTTALSTFTPCFNYLTGSSGKGGSSPTEDCCNTLKSAMTDSIDCACLIVTGNVPVSIPFVRTLALALPQMCNAGVPVQCKATGAPLPAASPAILSPPAPHSPPPRTPTPHPPAAPPSSHRAGAVSVVKMEKATSTVEAPTTPPTAAAAPPLFVPKTTPAGIRPVLVPSTSANSSYLISSSPSLLLLFLAFLNMFLYY
nr:classical arabinogalactan protein 9-like [Ipomoea batatas]